MKTHIKSLSIILMLMSLFLIFTTPIFAGKRLDKFGQALKDAKISTVVITKLTTNPILSPFKVKVSTENGVVTLSGLVNTDLQYQQAVILAQSTEGVKNVNAVNLKIKSSNNPVSDTLITAKIKGLLLRNKVFNGNNVSLENIRVETKNGIVYIVGTVANKKQKKYVIDTAKNVEGVQAVKADLKVQ